MLESILIAYDGGTQSNKALDVAIELAKNQGALIYLVSVYTSPVFYQGAEATFQNNSNIAVYLDENHRQHLEFIQEQAYNKIDLENIPVHKYIIEGKPGPILTAVAEGSKVDLIVIGSNNRTGLQRLFMGSVSNYVVRHANCAVLVVKD